MGLFNTYKTDTSLEKTGIVYTPDASTAITLARAGGGNTLYTKVLEAKAKPYRRQIEAGALDPALDRRMMAEVVAETIIQNWETLVTDKNGEARLVVGIEADPDAKPGFYTAEPDENGLVPFNKHNVVATLTALPDVLTDIQREANNASNYRKAIREDDAKN